MRKTIATGVIDKATGKELVRAIRRLRKKRGATWIRSGR